MRSWLLPKHSGAAEAWCSCMHLLGHRCCQHNAQNTSPSGPTDYLPCPICFRTSHLADECRLTKAVVPIGDFHAPAPLSYGHSGENTSLVITGEVSLVLQSGIEREERGRDEVFNVLPGPGCVSATIFALECLTGCPASLPRQLSEENANLQEYVEKEVEEKKKLSRTNEELLWKLQEGDAVSPVKLPPAPSTPFYRCSSGNSSPAKVRTLRR